MDERRLPFTEHLTELRRRLIWCIGALVVGLAFAWPFHRHIIRFLTAPLVEVLPEDASMIFIAPQEAFFASFKISIWAALLFVLPFIFYHAWRFVTPGLYDKERLYVAPFVVASTVLFIGGALFGFFIVFPIVYKYLINFPGEDLRPQITIMAYYSFSMRLLLAFGLSFEMPVVIFFLSRMGVVTHKTLLRIWRQAVVVLVAASAILTPPDVISQVLLAGPLILLYLVSILIARIFGKRPQREE